MHTHGDKVVREHRVRERKLGRHKRCFLISTKPETDKTRWVCSMFHIHVATLKAPPLLCGGVLPNDRVRPLLCVCASRSNAITRSCLHGSLSRRTVRLWDHVSTYVYISIMPTLLGKSIRGPNRVISEGLKDSFRYVNNPTPYRPPTGSHQHVFWVCSL